MASKHCNHRIFLYYPFDFTQEKFEQPTAHTIKKQVIDSLEELKVGDIAQKLSLPNTTEKCNKGPDGKGLLDRVTEKYSDMAVWEVDKKRTVSTDLYPHLRRILNVDSKGEAGQAEKSDLFCGHPSMHLGSQQENGKLEVVNLLTGALGQRGGGIEMQLKPSKQSEWARVLIEDVLLHLFGTGTSIMVFELTIIGRKSATDKCLPDELIEAVNRLSRNDGHAPEMRWADQKDSDMPVATFKLSDIVQALIPKLDSKKNIGLKSIASSRLFTYVALQLDECINVEQQHKIAFRLSRGYTDNYMPSDDEISKTLYQPFENVTHAASVEGGAVVVETIDQQGNPINHLKQYISTSAVQVYQPLALIAYQEYLTLLDMTQGVVMPIDFRNPGENECSQLSKYKDYLLNFRLNYRFSHASMISMHNTVYQRWREVLSLNKLLDEVNKDVYEVENYLGFKLDEQQNKRWAKFNHLQTMIGILIATVIGLTGYFGMNFTDPVMAQMKFFDKFFWGSVSFAFSMSIIMVIGYFIFVKRLDKSP